MNLAIPEPNPKHPDMSPEAIDLRLRQLGQIYKLAKSLRNAKWLGPITAPSGSHRQDDPYESGTDGSIAPQTAG